MYDGSGGDYRVKNAYLPPVGRLARDINNYFLPDSDS